MKNYIKRSQHRKIEKCSLGLLLESSLNSNPEGLGPSLFVACLLLGISYRSLFTKKKQAP